MDKKLKELLAKFDEKYPTQKTLENPLEAIEATGFLECMKMVVPEAEETISDMQGLLLVSVYRNVKGN